jgi:hypothetical protein
MTIIQRAALPKRGDVVMTDNLPVHNVASVPQAIEVVGATPRFLSPCSLDLRSRNGSQLSSALLRTTVERTIPGFLCGIARRQVLQSDKVQKCPAPRRLYSKMTGICSRTSGNGRGLCCEIDGENAVGIP